MRCRLFNVVLFMGLTGCSLFAPEQIGSRLPKGSVLLWDDFHSSTTGWDRTKYAEGVMDYDGGGYRMVVNAPQVNFWSAAHKDFKDVRVDADAGKLGGPDENRIGLICRADGGNYYFFVLSSDGYFGVGLFNHGQTILLGQTAMQYNDSIKTGVAVNHLRFDCNRDELTAYVNGLQVAAVRDQTLTHGDVGFLAGTFDQPGADIIFDNLVVLQP